MYIITTLDTDTEAGYHEYRKEADDKHAVARAISEAEELHDIPAHRLTVLEDIDGEVETLGSGEDFMLSCCTCGGQECPAAYSRFCILQNM